MGNNTSLMPNNTDLLFNLIKDETNKLINNYEFWTDSRICDKLELVYYDKLIQYKKDDLLNASIYIGVKQDTTIDKPKLCQNIIVHYKDRITLLKTIWDAVNKGYKRIDMAKNGPVCQNVDKFVEDFFTCQEYKGLWLNNIQYKNILQKIKKYNLNSDQINYITNLQKYLTNYMKQLYEAVILIKEDVSNTIDNVSFIMVRDRVTNIIKKMNYICDIYYLLTINYSS
jgi:hypothetical protein